jgi:hypothetical protein
VKSVTLGAKYLPSRHTGENISTMLKDSLADFDIDHSQIVGASTDGGQNMVNGMKMILDEPENHNICMCHLFATVVRHVMKKLDGRLTSLNKIQAHAYHLKMSCVSMEDFRESQYEQGATESSARKLKINVVTRWNSAYLSAVAYLELKHHVAHAANQKHFKGPDLLTKEDEEILKDYITVMKPLFDATIELSGDLYLTGVIRISNIVLFCRTFIIMSY